MEALKLYNSTMRRLGCMGIKDHTLAIIALAEEIEEYREKLAWYMDREPTARVAGGAGKFAEIVTRPVCGNCNAFIPGASAQSVRTTATTYTVCLSKSATFGRCPKCGATFIGIRQRVITPMEE